MPDVIEIADPDDPRVADYVRLTDPDLRRRRQLEGGEDSGFFIAEGLLVIRQLLASDYQIRSLLLAPRRWEALAGELDAVAAPIYVAGQDVVNAIAGFPLHRGALASADRRPLPDPAALLTEGLVVVTEGMNDHENLGALFRNAAAFGAAAVLLDASSCDPLYRRSIRVSMGHVLHVPFTRLPPLPEGLAVLRSSGYEVIALTPSSDAEDLRTVAPGHRQALIIGAEGPGLSAGVLAFSDRRVRIPMVAGVDSLNVSAAAAIALHQLSGLGT